MNEPKYDATPCKICALQRPEGLNANGVCTYCEIKPPAKVEKDKIAIGSADLGTLWEIAQSYGKPSIQEMDAKDDGSKCVNADISMWDDDGISLSVSSGFQCETVEQAMRLAIKNARKAKKRLK